MQPDDLYKIAMVEDAQISPDGRRVACVVRRMSREADSYRCAIWVAAADGGDPVQFTFGAGQDRAPCWSPDGQWLAFLSDRAGEKAQLWLLPAAGGEAQRLTDQPEAVERFAWSPHGDAIAFACRVPSHPSTTQAQTPESNNPAITKTKHAPARVIATLRYKSNGDGFVHDRRRHIFAISVDTGICQQLTFGDFEDADPAWSPDGASIAFSSARHAGHELDSAADVFLVPAEGGEPTRLTSTLGPAAAPAFSPSGTSLAYLGHDDRHAGGARNTTIWLVDREPSPATPLDLGLDRTVIADMPPVWTAGEQIVFAVADRGAAGVWRAATSGGSAAQLVGGDRAVSSWSLSADGSRLAFTASEPAQPPELFLLELDHAGAPTGADRRLTSFNDAWLGEVDLVRPEAIELTGADGWPIHGWLTRPARFEDGRRYPLLLNVHGGPHMYYGWNFFDEVQVQAGAGYATLCINPRGSQGYGEQFARACCGDWGGKDFEDLMRGVDETLRRFRFLDPDRTGVLGGSYGGFMTSWIVGQSERFKAAVSERAVNSLVSLFGTSDIGYWFEQFEVGGTPLDTPRLYAERSPLTYADRIRTPLLILHSENDLRCPIEQAEQLYVALKLGGQTDVAFVRFPEENHELSRSGVPSRRVERFEIILDWFDRHLRAQEQGEPRSAALTEALT
jgi:dipeptidyl aminopeptidase/acylaminoacyl peptidase